MPTAFKREAVILGLRGCFELALSVPGNTPLDLVWGELPPGARIEYPAASYTFLADQQLVVIDGGLTIRQDDTTYRLGAGDCLRFGPPRKVTFENTGSILCRYVIAVLRTVDRRVLDGDRR